MKKITYIILITILIIGGIWYFISNNEKKEIIAPENEIFENQSSVINNEKGNNSDDGFIYDEDILNEAEINDITVIFPNFNLNTNIFFQKSHHHSGHKQTIVQIG